MKTNYPTEHLQKGFSIVELMIAMLLSLLLLSGTVSLFEQSKRNYLQDEQVARMQENGRYAESPHNWPF